MGFSSEEVNEYPPGPVPTQLKVAPEDPAPEGLANSVRSLPWQIGLLEDGLADRDPPELFKSSKV
jgi:hypothetical protein